MNFTNKNKLYFSVFILLIFTYRLIDKIISGFKTQDFNYLRILLNIIIIVALIFNINKYYNNEKKPKE
jgi:hypothetical protein